MSAIKWCLVGIMVAVRLSSVHSDTGPERSFGVFRCTAADGPGTCLFKSLLKNALLYAASRREDVSAAADDGKLGDSGGGILQQQSKGIEEYLIEQIQNIIGLFSFGFDLPNEVTAPWSLLKSSFLNGRGKKNKNLGPMLAAGVAVMAGTLMPLAFGALFMLAGKAIMTSLMAITISGLLGLKSLFSKHESGHVKSYTAPSAAHYTETQFEQEMGMYKGQTEAKMHSSLANYYAGETNPPGAYFKGVRPARQQNQHDDDNDGGGSDHSAGYYSQPGPIVPDKIAVVEKND
ncbi:uncharacterized protein LOC112596823 [Melanaphis sacchari]|uniref:uncharacterized protein LOC112596823 n=1 Tax=Melanaphis sacchari TaxID=742174 RepID=UPI000DC13C9A|nr:uncharacterized protein LOC112596823 [Melanaphis sacchari]